MVAGQGYNFATIETAFFMLIKPVDLFIVLYWIF